MHLGDDNLITLTRHTDRRVTKVMNLVLFVIVLYTNWRMLDYVSDSNDRLLVRATEDANSPSDPVLLLYPVRRRFIPLVDEAQTQRYLDRDISSSKPSVHSRATSEFAVVRIRVHRPATTGILSILETRCQLCSQARSNARRRSLPSLVRCAQPPRPRLEPRLTTNALSRMAVR